jgi:hypothetical protein
MVMNTLNGLPRSWYAFIQGIFSRRKLPKFSNLWEDCNYEEARMAAREEKMKDDYQALVVHTKKGKQHEKII